MMMNYFFVIIVIGKDENFKKKKILFILFDSIRAYHMDCLNPPLNEPPPGAWYCQLCT
jgi:hypothetical protein